MTEQELVEKVAIAISGAPFPTTRSLNKARAALSVIREELVGSRAALDVLAERKRQISAEGWTPEHDDEHSCGELADAAACYAAPAPHGIRVTEQDDPPKIWPWHRSWWKPKDRRRNLVKAAALILAEIERIDRAMIAASPIGEK